MRKLLYSAALLFSFSFLFSCGNNTKDEHESDSTAIRLAVLPTADCLPFYYAESQGLFDSLGIDIELITFDAAMDADTAFANGDVDGIVSDVVKACLWKQTNDSLFIAMNGDLNLSLVTAKNARIKQLSSMKEKIIAFTRHSVLDYMADRIMESQGFVSTDLNKPQINKISLRALMVDQNQYDGAILPEPFASETVARGAKRLISNKELNLYGLMAVVFNDSVAKIRKEELSKIATVYDLAVDALNSDTTNSQLSFLPQDNILLLPDTLYSPVAFTHSTTPSDSLSSLVFNWLKGRGLVK